jgi:hypothetical protein
MSSRFWRNLAAAACAFLVTAARPSRPRPDQGRATITVGGDTVTQVSLPYPRPRAGHAPREATFEVSFRLRRRSIELHGLYLARIGNSAEIWHNDSLLAQLGDIRKSNDSD